MNIVSLKFFKDEEYGVLDHHQVGSSFFSSFEQSRFLELKSSIVCEGVQFGLVAFLFSVNPVGRSHGCDEIGTNFHGCVYVIVTRCGNMAFQPNSRSDDAIKLIMIFLWELSGAHVQTFIFFVNSSCPCGFDEFLSGVDSVDVVISLLGDQLTNETCAAANI